MQTPHCSDLPGLNPPRPFPVTDPDTTQDPGGKEDLVASFSVHNLLALTLAYGSMKLYLVLCMYVYMYTFGVCAHVWLEHV